MMGTKSIKHKSKINFLIISFALFLFSVFCFLFSVPASAQDESTSSVRDIVREKVKEKLDILLRKPKAVVGVLDELTASTLRIEAEDGEIVLVSVTNDTTYARVLSKKMEDIKFNDLALGNFIVAMGFKNDKNVLGAERIIAYDQNPLPQKQAVFGTVTGVTKNTISITELKTNQTWTIKIVKSTKLTKKTGEDTKEIKISDIGVNDRVITAGTLDPQNPKTIEAGRIHET